MKICAIICEFNPFHNGHRYLIKRAKELTGCDYVLCIMSGSFTQRGEICVMDKFTRAKHAVLCGADCVIELPAAFTVAPAEVFARGAVKILNSVPQVEFLAFGCENAKADFFGAAKLLLEEAPAFKEALKAGLACGTSYIKSYFSAFEACGGQKDLLNSPNNILGTEYAKAILNFSSKIKIIPVQRRGANYGDGALKADFSSAEAIRNNVADPAVKDNVPPCVFADLRDFSAENALFDDILAFGLLKSDPQNLKRIYGCTEGLENGLAALAGNTAGHIISAAAGKRYPRTRIRRILLANLLGAYKDDCDGYLGGSLYIKPLAIKKEAADLLLPALAQSPYPTVLKKRDLNRLSPEGLKCFELDLYAQKLRDFITKRAPSDFDYPIFV